MHTATVINGLRIAKARAVQLHEMVIEANKQLEHKIDAERNSRMVHVRKMQFARQQEQAAKNAAGENAEHGLLQTGGIDRDDPVLGWNLLHRVHQEQ